MARERKKKGKAKPILERSEEVAERYVSGKDNARVLQRMRCNYGTTTIRDGKEEIHYANGEVMTEHGLMRVTVEGGPRDTVRLMFDAAIERVGFKVV